MEKNDSLYFKFTIVCDCTKLGESVHVTGNQIHNWNSSKSIELKTSSKLYPIWESEIICLNIAYDKPFEYKYLIKKGNNIVKWENFNGNRTISKLNNTGDEFKNFIQVSKGTFGYTNPQTIKFGDNLIVQPKVETTPPIVLIKKEFIISDDDEKLIEYFLENDSINKTWKKKLEFVNELVSQRTCFSNKLLALISSYLFFLNTGQIKCEEDGTHYRPNHHAGIALNICSIMLKCQTEENSYIIRSIIKELPSFSSQFMVTVPFTRIRDIAHRNDIPKDLKTEIKHTLQNKLHRSASPEDLKTCEKIYNKIKDGQYSEEFVEQFTIFYEELKEFFNALSVDKVLLKVKESNYDLSESIEKFLLLKNSSDNHKISKNMLTCLTELRDLILQKLEKELYQTLYIADIELENYLFAYLSLFLNKFDKPTLKVNINDVQELLLVISFCLNNLIYSKVYSTESKIIMDDINHFRNKNTEPENLLILKAILERLLNLCYSFTTDVIKNYTEIVNVLGLKLKIPENSVKVFSEAFIRTHTIFQLTKVISIIFTYIRIQLNLPPYISISIGNSEGYFLNLEDLSEFHKKHNKFKKIAYILFLNNSDGSEELPIEVKGVVLAHDLPQLSHLAIRARQQKAVFACCCDIRMYQEFLNKYKENQIISLSVKDNVEIKTSDSKDLKFSESINNNEYEDVLLNGTEDFNSNKCLEDGNTLSNYTFTIENAEKSLNGAKAFNIKQLNLVKCPLYEIPNSYTIPFSTYSEYFRLIEDYLVKEIDNVKEENIESASNKFRKEFEEICLRNKEILERIYCDISSYFNFGNDNLYAFRSSSNLEDLSKNAGAGLFDSILGIRINEKEKVIQSIISVWSSLFTSRGLQFRRKNKIPSSFGKMGVLIQEMINPQLSFIIHTVNPISLNQREVYIEIALGLGETLASANLKGSPFRISYSKDNSKISIINYSSYNKALVRVGNTINYKLLSFKDERVFNDKNYLFDLINKLGLIALHLEENFKGPQDIEGCVKEDKIYLVQTRPQII